MTSPNPPSISSSAGEVIQQDCFGVNAKVVQADKVEVNIHHGVQPVQYSKIQADIKGMLQIRYRNMHMPKMPWMHDWFHPLKDYYVDLTLHSKVQERQLTKNIPLEDIFKPVGAVVPTRILIEGPAGYGKTTLALKLCNDWSNQEESYIFHFKIVLLVQLRNLTRPLTDIVATLCQVSSTDSKTVLNAIENCQKEVLLILDGFDEIPVNCKKYLDQLIKGEQYAEMTVVITSRNGFFDFEDATAQNRTFRLPIPNLEIADTFTYKCDKRITIKGITGSSINTFLEKYFEKMPNQEQVSQAKEALSNNFGLVFDDLHSNTQVDRSHQALPLPVTDLLECPLFLLLIVILVSETKIESLTTKTELYKVLFNFVVRRGLSKTGILDEVDMFEFNKQAPPAYITTLSKFAGFALHALKENKLSFTLDDILSHCEDDTILKFGFMTRNESVDGLRTTVSYEPVHKSVLEFAAAYHVWYAFYTDSSNHHELTVKVKDAKPLLVHQSIHKTSLVCSFVTSLMGNHVVDLLRILESLQETTNDDTSWFNAHTAILAECTLTEELLSFVSSFLTPVWVIDSRVISKEFFKTPLHKALLEYGLRTGVVTGIFWNQECTSVNFPESVNVKKIVLQTEATQVFDATTQLPESMKCEELYCWLCSEEKGYWQNLKLLLGRITFQKISFHLTKEAVSFLFYLEDEVTKGVLRKAQIHWVRCELYSKKSHFLKIIARLIREDKIGSIYLTFLKACDDSALEQSFKPWWCLKCIFGKCDIISKAEWKSFTKRCRKSRRLRDFVLTNFDTPLSCDLHQLCVRNQTPLRIDLQQNIIIARVEQFARMEMVSVDHFRATDFLECDFDVVVRACRIKSLECSNVCYKSSTLQLLDLLQYDNWPLCATLTHLYIVLDRDIFENNYFSRMEKLQNLNVLALEMDIVTAFSKECGMTQLLFILDKCTSLQRLEFWNIQYMSDQPNDFFSEIEKLATNDGMCSALKTIMLQGDINETTWGDNFEDLLSFLTPLKEMMVHEDLTELWLVNEEQHYFKNSKHDWETTRLLQKCLQSSVFVPEDGFEIAQDLLGMKAEDSHWSKRGWENPFEKHTNFRFYKHTFYSQHRFCIRKEAYVTYC